MVNNAASALRDAMDKLVKGADKSVLKQNIEIVQNELKETDYTPDSWAAVKKALDEAIEMCIRDSHNGDRGCKTEGARTGNDEDGNCC